MDDPRIVSRDEWLAARGELPAQEKEFTRQRDALNTERRKLPMVEIDRVPVAHQAETRSHTKMRVSPGAITFPAPRSP
jgi:predicted dithiol-disulfide oxidoreductase (DUF899 family)